MDWIQGKDVAFQLPAGGIGIDIRKEIGVRFFVYLEAGKTIILTQLHHAAVDAKGGGDFWKTSWLTTML